MFVVPDQATAPVRTIDGASPQSAHARPGLTGVPAPAGPGWIRAVVIVAFAAMMVMAAGAFAVLWATDSLAEPPIRIDDPLIDAAIVVAIDGAVATPGLYELPGGSRVQHALDAAGGVTSNADLAAVNPAERIADGQRILIPIVNQTPTSPTTARGQDEAAVDGAAPVAAMSTLRPDTPDSVDESGSIDLNTATQAELETLPGIGPVKAAAIIAYRAEHGAFTDVSELDDVDGISPAIVAELASLVSVGP